MPRLCSRQKIHTLPTLPQIYYNKPIHYRSPMGEGRMRIINRHFTNLLDGYDRLVDLLREEEAVTRQLFVDMGRLVSAYVEGEDD